LEQRTPQERERILAEQLKESALSKRALILKVSHIGGHKYAGNAVVSHSPIVNVLTLTLLLSEYTLLPYTSYHSHSTIEPSNHNHNEIIHDVDSHFVTPVSYRTNGDFLVELVKPQKQLRSTTLPDPESGTAE
jgi:hypothetical protein